MMKHGILPVIAFPMTAIILITLLAVSCARTGKGMPKQTETPSLEYVGKLCNLEAARNIEVTDDGLILAHSSEAEQASPIYVYSKDGTYIGTLKSNETEIMADAIFVDSNNLMCAFDRERGTLCRFKTDGKPVDERPLAPDIREIPVSDSGLAPRDDGTLLVAPTGIRGRLSLMVLDKNLSVIRSLSGTDIANMLVQPVGSDAGAQATIQAISSGTSGFSDASGSSDTSGSSNTTLIVLAFGKGPYDRNDGILELDANLAFVRYIGTEGQFNAGEDACVDSAGIRYVADTWNRRLCAYDSQWNIVAVSARDRRGKPLVVNPHCVRVKGDDVYVVAYGKERTFEAAALHRFKTWRPQSKIVNAANVPTASENSGD